MAKSQLALEFFRTHEEITLPSSESRMEIRDFYYHLMVEGADEFAIIMLDPEGRVASWNRGAERITGYTREEILGQFISRLFPPEDVWQHEQELRQARTEGRGAHEGWYLRKDGRRFWGSGVVTPIRDTDGRLAGFSKIMRDITDRKRFEDQLAHKARELANINAELEQFAAVVSHDLRSPLLAIAGCAQLLGEQIVEQLGGEGAELISMIQDGVNRMGLIIKDLLAFARATPARDRVEEVDMNEVLSKALSDLNEPVAESGAVITHDPLPRVMGNANQLGQVLNNLIGNAIKYRSGEPPRIHVSAVERARDWEFSVRDNGIGIDPAHFERIFAIFQRLHEDGRYAGSGVGLAICKKIVEHHQGRIWLDSQPGRGSTFFFTVPKQTDGPGI